jgi:GT2 family glycosyltransferase
VTVAAIVVRWRGGDEVDRCLRSLVDHGGSSLRSIVLVDSGSGDGGAEALASKYPQVDVLALDENRSFAWAADRGAERCHEPMLLFLNPDAELTSGSLDALVESTRNHPDAAGAAPLLSGDDGRSQCNWQLRLLPGWVRLAVGLGGARAFPAGEPSDPAPVAQPAAAAWLVRRSVWDALDGLDPRYAPAWWEDVDFCARLAARLGKPGFPAREGFWVVPESRVRHTGGSSVRQLGTTEFLTAYYWNLLRYAERHHANKLGVIRLSLRLSLIARGMIRPASLSAYWKTGRSLGRLE